VSLPAEHQSLTQATVPVGGATAGHFHVVCAAARPPTATTTPS
jgi:hypothetical protein